MPLPSKRAIAEPDRRARELAERGRRTGLAEDLGRIPKRDPSWKRPSRRRVLAIRDRLRQMYGRPVNEPHGHPIAELVRTILSQNTNDRNRDVAYGRMRERFPTWEEVRDAPPGELEEALRPGGLAPSKTPRIQHVLEQHRRPSRPRLARRGAAAARPSTTSPTCPGSAARPRPASSSSPSTAPRSRSTPTSTGSAARLGLFRAGASFDEAHDEMLAITPPEDAYELHVNLIRHGRALCRPRPRCERMRAAPDVPLLQRGRRGGWLSAARAAICCGRR